MHTITAQIPDEMADKLAQFAQEEGRSKSWMVKEAVGDYIAKQEDIRKMTLEGLKAAREGKLIPHEEILKELEQWGTK